jgi:hypothetical protein
LKQTVSTAAFSRATDITSKNSASAPYVRKMSMSASSGATHMSSASPSGRKSTNTHRRLPPQVNETSGLGAAASMFGY